MGCFGSKPKSVDDLNKEFEKMNNDNINDMNKKMAGLNLMNLQDENGDIYLIDLDEEDIGLEQLHQQEQDFMALQNLHS